MSTKLQNVLMVTKEHLKKIKSENYKNSSTLSIFCLWYTSTQNAHIRCKEIHGLISEEHSKAKDHK